MEYKSKPNLFRRTLLQGLGITAIYKLTGCGGTQVASIATNSPVESVVPLADVVNGYTDRQSYRSGDKVSFFLNGDKEEVAGFALTDLTGRIVWSGTGSIKPQTPAGPIPWETGFGYETSFNITLPKLTSGFYLLNKKIPVLVKAPTAQPVDIVIVYPSNTEAAYNDKGGKSMYTTPVAAPVVSFQRPAKSPLSTFCEPFLRWMAGLSLPYSVRYIADIDMDDYAEISDAKVVMVVGHSEYWTRLARENFDKFVLAGGNALILSGNSMWWQVRYSNNQQQMLCYKDASPDPVSDPLMKTTNWDAPSLKFPIINSIGADFPHGGYGLKNDKGYDGFSILQPNSPLLAGLSLKKGDIISLPTVELDGAPLINKPVTNGLPILDVAKIGAHKAEIIGYDYGFRSSDTVGTWIVMQRTPTSGTIINGASTDWCSANGVGGKDGEKIKAIILNMMNILVNNKNAFSS